MKIERLSTMKDAELRAIAPVPSLASAGFCRCAYSELADAQMA